MTEITVRHGVIEDIDVQVDATGDAGWPVVLIDGWIIYDCRGFGRSDKPMSGSCQRTHAALRGSELHVIARAPRGCNIGHPDEWNAVLLTFHAK